MFLFLVVGVAASLVVAVADDDALAEHLWNSRTDYNSKHGTDEHRPFAYRKSRKTQCQSSRACCEQMLMS